MNLELCEVFLPFNIMHADIIMWVFSSNLSFWIFSQSSLRSLFNIFLFLVLTSFHVSPPFGRHHFLLSNRWSFLSLYHLLFTRKVFWFLLHHSLHSSGKVHLLYDHNHCNCKTEKATTLVFNQQTVYTNNLINISRKQGYFLSCARRNKNISNIYCICH